MKNTDVKIIQFEPRYRDDLIFMILEAKNALGRAPGLNEDLLDIEKHYFAKGDMFWIAVGENDRVIGSVGYNSIPDTSEICLHRLFVKADLKHQGIGTKLLASAETYAKEYGKTAIYVHLGTPKEQWAGSYRFYPKHGYAVYDVAKPNYMKKELTLKRCIMNTENTNWGQSVAGVLIRDGKVLLARHTYGNGKGLLITPGGYLEYGETPQDALKREFLEETNIHVEPKELIAIRFNSHDWYVVFSAEYISGDEASDHDENSEVIWLDVDEALQREDVADLTKQLIRCAINAKYGLVMLPYEGNPKHGKGYLYGIGAEEQSANE